MFQWIWLRLCFYDSYGWHNSKLDIVRVVEVFLVEVKCYFELLESTCIIIVSKMIEIVLVCEQFNLSNIQIY